MIRFLRIMFGRRALVPASTSREAWHEIIETVMCDRTMRHKACYPRELLESATDLVMLAHDKEEAITIIEKALRPFELQS